MSDETKPDQQPKGQQGGRVQLQPFTVEFGNDYGQNFTISSPPLQVIVRGAFSIARMARRPEGMRAVGDIAGRIPDLPGMRLAVDPRRKKVRLYDPCMGESKDDHKFRDALARYNKLAKGNPFALDEKAAVPETENDLNDDQLKTLLHELLRKQEAKCIDVTSGRLPTAEEIETLAGDELYDPSNSSTSKPKYKKDVDAYEQRLAAAGR